LKGDRAVPQSQLLEKQ